MAKSPKKLGYYLERTTRIVKLKFTQVFKDHGIDLTPEQWVILDSLYAENGLSQVELAKLSFKNAPTVSRIIDLLEKKTFVERRKNTEDRRIIKVYLTDVGRQHFEGIFPKVQEIRRNSWNGLSEEDYEHFIKTVNKVFNNIESME